MKQIKFYFLAVVLVIAVVLYFLPDEEPALKPQGTAPTATSSDSEINKNHFKEFGEVKVHIIDIGQGDAILIEGEKDTVLIDGGNKGRGDDILNYLHTNGINKLTAVVSTHPDADHVGGLSEIIRGIEVESIYAPRVTHTTEAYKQFLLSVQEKELKIKVAKNGVSIPGNSKNLVMDFIGPTKEYSQSDLNDWSAVLKVTHGEKVFLFTGDAETPAENDMLDANLLEPVDVLKVSHHGASEATNTDFLNIVKPKMAAISVGEGNRYGHPTQAALKRLKDADVTIYRTDEQGNIIFVSNGKNIIVKVDY